MPRHRRRLRRRQDSACCARSPISMLRPATFPSTARSGARCRRTFGGGACATAPPSRRGGRTRRAPACRRRRRRGSIGSCKPSTSTRHFSIVRSPRLSTGERQRLALVRALLDDAEGAAARRADRRARSAVVGARRGTDPLSDRCRGIASCSSATIARRSSAWRTHASSCPKPRRRRTATPRARHDATCR